MTMMTTHELLALLGFESIGVDPDARELTRWLCAQTCRHLLISLPRDASHGDVMDAIYDSGRRDQQALIMDRHSAFARSLRTLEPIPPPVPVHNSSSCAQ